MRCCELPARGACAANAEAAGGVSSLLAVSSFGSRSKPRTECTKEDEFSEENEERKVRAIYSFSLVITGTYVSRLNLEVILRSNPNATIPLLYEYVHIQRYAYGIQSTRNTSSPQSNVCARYSRHSPFNRYINSRILCAASIIDIPSYETHTQGLCN